MDHVIVNVGVLGFSVGVSRVGVIKGSTALDIHGYSKDFTQWKYDPAEKRWVLLNEFFHFCDIKKECYFPKYDLDNFLAFLTGNRTPYVLNVIPGVVGKDISFEMLPHINYKNEKQRSAVEFLTDETKGPLRGLALQTGEGKTVSAIWALQKLKKRSMITMTSRLEQWFGEMPKYTTVDEDDVYLIQGLPSLEKLFNQIDKNLHPKIILASTKTIRLYLEYGPTYQHLPHPSEMCEKLGIGIIGTDEYHEHFMTNYMIGIVLNPALFIPITATFIANDPFIKNIFNKFIPSDLQFTGGAYNKFVSVTSYMYKGGKGFIKPFNYTARGVYSQVQLENFLLSTRGIRFFESVLHDAMLPIIKNHYINIMERGEKFLLLCSTQKMCNYLKDILSKAFPDKSVSVFYSGMSVITLEKFDMIISTPGSAGCLTGDTVVSISRNKEGDNAGSYLCTLKNAYLHFNNLAKNRAYNWDREIPTYIRSYNGKTIQLGQVGDIVYSGVKEVYRVTLSNGFSIKATNDHPIMTSDGYVHVKDIVGKYVMCEETRLPIKGCGRQKIADSHVCVSEHHPYARKSTKSNKGRKYVSWRIELHRAIYEAIVLNKMTLTEYREALKDPDKIRTMEFVDSTIYEIHHIDHDHYNNDPSNLRVMTKYDHKKLHSEETKSNFNQGVSIYSEAMSVEYVGEEDTYDIHCLDENHNFVANGIVVHNTGRDIKGLRTCLVFENTASEIRNSQFLGRLRGPPQMMNTPEFCTLGLSAIPQHQKYSDIRAILYSTRAKTFKHREIG